MDDDKFMSSLEVFFPDDMLEKMKVFHINEAVKIQCYLGYWQECHQLQLMASMIEEICGVKVIVE